MSDVKTVEPGGTVQIDVMADDEDGDDLIYHYDVTDGSISGSGSKVQWTAPGYEGTFKIDVWVSDGEEQSKRDSLSIVVAKPEDSGDENAFIPGFDMVLVMMAIMAVVLYMIRKREMYR
jgi:hypothetical protein